MTKPVSLLCGVSLLVNAVLLVFLAIGSSSEAGKASVSGAGQKSAHAGQPEAPAIDASVWPNLRTEDLPALLARLREAGFPPDIIRAIIAAEVNELFSARRKALDPEAASRPYWKSRTRDPKVEAALRQLNRDQQKMVSDLIGKENDSGFASTYENRQLDGVPAEKREDVRQLLRDYNEKRSEVFGEGTISPMDRAKLIALDKEHHQALAAILSPTELAEYDVRTSNTSNLLRYELTAFNPSEDEFRRLYELKRPFDEIYNNNNYGMISMSQEQMLQRREAEKQLNEQIKAALGPERGAEYERSTDYNYRQASQLVARLELPPETTTQLWNLQQDIQQRTRELYTDTSLASGDRTQKLAALAEEAKTRVTASLGAQGYEAYKQYGGQWLQQLQPRRR